MKLFYDLRLGYFVSAPGVDSELGELEFKAGDTEEVIVQFGRSSDPTGSNSILDAPTWTAENLVGGTVITIGLKQDGKYSDGDILATTSSPTHNSTDKLYTFSLGLNTTEINTALERLNADDTDDVAELACQFELTFQVGGSGGWRSSVRPVPATLYHDVIGGSEGTPTNAADPDEYLLKAAGIEFYATVTSKTGGTAADLDAIPTTALTVGKLIQFRDTDASPTIVRTYQLTAGTDAESSPDVIRPDDYATTTNEKVWKLQIYGTTSLTGATGATDNAIIRSDGTGGSTIQSSGITIADGATGTLSGTNSGDVTLAASVADVLDISGQVLAADDPGADRLLFWDDSESKLRHLTPGTGLAITATTIDATQVSLGASVADVFDITSQVLSADDPGGDRIIFWDDSESKLRHLTIGSGLSISTTTLSASGAVPYPSSQATASSSGNVDQLISNGGIIFIDNSGGSVTLTIRENALYSYPADFHFYVCWTTGSNTSTLARGVSVALFEGASDADITLSQGVTYHVWRSASDSWRVIGRS